MLERIFLTAVPVFLFLQRQFYAFGYVRVHFVCYAIWTAVLTRTSSFFSPFLVRWHLYPLFTTQSSPSFAITYRYSYTESEQSCMCIHIVLFLPLTCSRGVRIRRWRIGRKLIRSLRLFCPFAIPCSGSHLMVCCWSWWWQCQNKNTNSIAFHFFLCEYENIYGEFVRGHILADYIFCT